MADLSATRQIESVSTPNGIYFVGTGYGYYQKITVTEKSEGIIWYQLWQNNQVVKEINSRQVIDVDYKKIIDGDIPF